MGFYNIINYPILLSLIAIFGDLGLELTAAAFFWPVYTLYFISFMSADNLNYILNNNQEFKREKLKVNPNSFEVNENALSFENDPYIKYNIPKYSLENSFSKIVYKL
jgi:hypothetical protein